MECPGLDPGTMKRGQGGRSMLVLSRKTSQRITIGGDVVVTVLRTDRGTVKLGIDAPPEVKVVRGEILNHNESQSVSDVIRRLDLVGTTGH